MPLPEIAADSQISEFVEDGKTFAEIAQAKAMWFSRHIPFALIIASDGGLFLPALNSEWDPVRTARFVGPAATGAERVASLLERASHLGGADRRIGWTEALALGRNGQLLATWIAHSPPGELAADSPPDFDPASGFWVPYLWRCPEYGRRRLSELTEHERLARRDHWAVLADHLEGWLTGDRT